MESKTINERVRAEYALLIDACEAVCNDIIPADKEIRRKLQEDAARNPQKPDAVKEQLQSEILNRIKEIAAMEPRTFHITPMKAVISRLAANPKIIRSVSHPALIVNALRKYRLYDSAIFTDLMATVMSNPDITAEEMNSRFCYSPEILLAVAKGLALKNKEIFVYPELEVADFLHYLKIVLFEIFHTRKQAIKIRSDIKGGLSDEEIIEAQYLETALRVFSRK